MVTQIVSIALAIVSLATVSVVFSSPNLVGAINAFANSIKAAKG